MKFSKLARYFSKIESTASRNEMTAILADLIKSSSKEEVDKICYLSLGRLAPLYEGVEFFLAEKMMLKVLSHAYGADEAEVKETYKDKGDLGETAEDLANSVQRTANGKKKAVRRTRSETATPPLADKPLAISQVYDQLREVAEVAGTGSQEKKIRGMAGLLQELDPLSVRYVVRIPLGKLRLGFSDKTILDALSWVVAGDKSLRDKIEDAYNNRADIGQIAQIVKDKGVRGLGRIKVKLGVPIMPALCQRLPTAEEMIEKMCPPSHEASGGKIAVEPKYDGTRLQIHFSQKEIWKKEVTQLALNFKQRGSIRTFTRNLENTTHMFPDLASAMPKEVKAKEVILDCEAIGIDPKTGKFLPFQETIKRKRKHGIGEKAKEIPLKFFCFDILYKDGKGLLTTPFNKRREALEETVPSQNETIVPSPQIVTDDPKELRRYHNEQIKKGLEGVVAKKWEAPYDPGRRGYTWVKLKQEKGKHGGGLADTIDAVVMGYYKGKGKRAQFGVGAFLVGVRGSASLTPGVKSPKTPGVSPAEDIILTISKIGTGLTDEQWRELKVRSDKCKVKSEPKEYQVDKNLAPDVWCEPEIVVEIEADNVTKSPIHTAGLALRFPRLVRFRDDKSPDQATTVKEVETLFKQQKSHK